MSFGSDTDIALAYPGWQPPARAGGGACEPRLHCDVTRLRTQAPARIHATPKKFWLIRLSGWIKPCLCWMRFRVASFSMPPCRRPGGGGMMSTLFDCCRFLAMLAGGGTIGAVWVLREETVAAMTANQLTGARFLVALGPKRLDGWGCGLGLGVLVGVQALKAMETLHRAVYRAGTRLASCLVIVQRCQGGLTMTLVACRARTRALAWRAGQSGQNRQALSVLSACLAAAAAPLPPRRQA